MSQLRIAIAGVGGRMGLNNLRAVLERQDDFRLTGALERPGSALVGRDAGHVVGLDASGIVVSDTAEAALADAEAILDFTAPAVSVMLAERAAQGGLAHVIGTTGFSDEETWTIAKAGSAGARIVKSGNFSLGVNLLAGLVRQAAEKLGPEFDIEILELHHNQKVDAPSGTALLLAEAAAEGRGIALGDNSIPPREGHTGKRAPGGIGFASLRGGTVVGDHTVFFAGARERIELTHRAEDRAVFTQGALHAALWAAQQPPGLYSMADVLGFARS